MFRFLGIGAQKAGTTWLYNQLASHPGIGFPGPAERVFRQLPLQPDQAAPGPKEQHFWNRWSADDNVALTTYLAQFADPLRAEGEITPAYALLAPDVIARIREAAPDLRLIYLLRNPVDRAWSAALMALQRAELALDEVDDDWFMRHFQSRGSRARGNYLAALQTWGRFFPPEQLQVELYESIMTEPRALLERVAHHIGVDPAPFRALPDSAVTARVFAGSGHPLPDRLRERLRTLYGADIKALEAYLQRPLPW
ncbi:sulfotransferase [Thiohalocapsa marina]|uniref:Sulfotransferase n=1 Tax=Thiohalocapsa marina TaxID=424902 RepID=A0A5M8FU21_9GAMM|nr:sulfotransferase [Thiohalocapsa marina]KAA6187295.1 sulfotransferase [Thiohalocapsa marina]